MKVSDLMVAMSEAGAPMAAILIAVRALEERDAQIAERDAERAGKRAKDAARKKEERDAARRLASNVHGQSMDNPATIQGPSVDCPSDVQIDPSLSLLPNENKSNPTTHTHPDLDIPPARKAHRFPADFPCPEWAEADVWADLLKNRRTKDLTNTATAHRKFVRAVEGMVDDEWPPGRLLEAIVALGWGGAYDPRETRNERPPRLSQPRTVRQRASACDHVVDHRDGFERTLDDSIYGTGAAAIG
ncbi:hypothetical protein [uncultured Novosphingobium sp.]|uniref:hypothetical protein n=1 Tax=uncultured Novosphingobium sp. TaxID=292277 RepID=UPI003749AA29